MNTKDLASASLLLLLGVALGIWLDREWLPQPASRTSPAAPSGKPGKLPALARPPASRPDSSTFPVQSDPAGQPLGASEFAFAFNAAMSQRNPDNRLTQLIELAERVLPAEASRAMPLLDQVTRRDHRSALLGVLIGKWAGADPAAALAYAQQLTRGPERLSATVTALGVWAAADNSAALAWAQTQPPGNQRNQAFQAVLGQLAETDPGAALAELKKAGLTSLTSGLPEAIFQHWAGTDPATAAAKALTELPPGRQRDSVLQLITATWAASDPVAAAAWVRQQPDGKGKRELIQNLSDTLAATDPKAAVELALTLPEGGNRQQALAQIASRWGSVDLDAALDWVKQLPAGQARDNALLNLSHEWAEANPRAVAEFAAAPARWPHAGRALHRSRQPVGHERSRVGVEVGTGAPRRGGPPASHGNCPHRLGWHRAGGSRRRRGQPPDRQRQTDPAAKLRRPLGR